MVSQEQGRPTCFYRQVRKWRIWLPLQEGRILFCARLRQGSQLTTSTVARYIAYSRFLSKSSHRGSLGNSTANLCPFHALSKHCQYPIIDEKAMTGIKFLDLLEQL